MSAFIGIDVGTGSVHALELEKLPVGRLEKVVEDPAVVVYLAASDWLMGSQLIVDGGLTAVR